MTTPSKFTPSGDRLLIERDATPKETKGGLHIPETAKQNPTLPVWGTVLSIGPGRSTPEGKTVPIAFAPGQRVLILPMAGTDLHAAFGVEKDTLYLYSENSILGSLPREV